MMKSFASVIMFLCGRRICLKKGAVNRKMEKMGADVMNAYFPARFSCGARRQFTC